MLGVHGNGLTHLLWMPATPRSAVIEMFIRGGFARDCKSRRLPIKIWPRPLTPMTMMRSHHRPMDSAKPGHPPFRRPARRVFDVAQRAQGGLPGRIPGDWNYRQGGSRRPAYRRSTGRKAMRGRRIPVIRKQLETGWMNG
jgi:hypothetical protein